MAENKSPRKVCETVVERSRKNLSALRQNSENIPFYSPCLKDLQNGPSRVKKLSRLFEEKSKAYSVKTNWWLDDTIQKSSPPVPMPRISVSRAYESPGKLASKLERITQEFLQNEAHYIQALERGMDLYVSVIKAGGPEVPEVLRHQVFKLFGNIEQISALHKKSVFPRLSICNGNVQLMAETMSSFIKNDQFYCYIVYGMNQKYAEQLISCHSQFFEGLRNFYHDLQGVNSFLIQPIQRIPKLKMFFDEFIKELSKDMPLHKSAVAACCVAEKDIQRLLIRLNEALTVTQIIETSELKPLDQLSMLTSMQKDFGVNVNEPMLLLVPRSNSVFPFRSPFNVYDLGKFHKIATLKAFECATGRTFNSKVFVFEKCLLYTKVINESSLGYRSHYPFNGSFAFIMNESILSIRVTGSVKKKFDVEFTSENLESISEMKKAINQFYDPRRSADSAFTEELMIIEDQHLTDDDDWECVKPDETTCIANSRFYVKSPDGSQR